MIHYLIDQMCYKSNSGSFYCDLTDKSTLSTLSFLLRWMFILGVWIDEYIRNTIPSLRNIISSLQGDLIGISWGISRFDLSFNHGV